MNAHDENLQPEHIESEIAHTRAEVSSTIDAIQRKLTPGQLMDQAVDYFRTSAPADFGANLSRSIRDNPIPVALVGVGIAWLMMSGQAGRGRQHSQSEQYAGMNPGALTEGSAESGVNRAASAAADAGRKVKDTMSEMTSRAGDMMTSARERISATAGDTRMRVSELSARTREQMYRTRGTLTHVLEEQPLVVGAIGLAVGAVLGASLPSTRREDELMGGTRDDMMHSARDAVGEQAEALKESAQRIAETAGQEASRRTQEAGMTGAEKDAVPGTRTEGGTGHAAGVGAESPQMMRPRPSPSPGSRI
jgi:ElaB/YqjD/DUF883 family membrane-anchored ribosome-binding protein